MEELRLGATRELELLDTEPEMEFDELARLAANVCGTPMSAISLIDQHRLWFKARVGITADGSPREHAFCDHTIRSADMFIVEDATRHPCFQNNPFVTADNGVRFYAGAPVSGRDGLRVGALCVLDTQPRCLSGDQRKTLEIIARQVGVHLELRLRRRNLQRALEERTALVAELGASNQLFQTFMHHSPMASFIKDGHGKFVFYNRRLAEIAGIDMVSALGKTDAELWPDHVVKALRENDQRALVTGELVEVDETTELDGKRTNWRCFKFPWRNSKGEQLLAGIAVDVTAERQHAKELCHYQRQLEEANARLQRSANTDSLTGLANRRALDDGLEAAKGTPVTPGSEIAILTIDVDHFKQVNDTYGHAYGDRALRQIADVISRCTRAQDLTARSGGEEFIVLLPESGSAIAVAIAQRIVQELQKTTWDHHPISVSIGVSSVAIDDPDLSCVLARSDRALYDAKQQGRNRVVYLNKSKAESRSWQPQVEKPGELPAFSAPLPSSKPQSVLALV